MENDLTKIRSVADYQFGKGVGRSLFPENVKISYSRNTGRIRYVHLKGKRLATLRPTDGLFSLSIKGAKRMLEGSDNVKYVVKVRDDVAEFIAGGGDVFAVHVVEVDEAVRSKDEVVVTDEKRNVLAVGRAALSGGEMRAFKRGVAVKTRRGNMDEG